MNTTTPPHAGHTSPFFAFSGIVKSLCAGDADAAACDAAALQSMSLSVLKCLYVHLADEATRGDLSREEISDIVAVAGGMIELSGTVGDFVRDKKEDLI